MLPPTALPKPPLGGPAPTGICASIPETQPSPDTPHGGRVACRVRSRPPPADLAPSTSPNTSAEAETPHQTFAGGRVTRKPGQEKTTNRKSLSPAKDSEASFPSGLRSDRLKVSGPKTEVVSEGIETEAVPAGRGEEPGTLRAGSTGGLAGMSTSSAASGLPQSPLRAVDGNKGTSSADGSCRETDQPQEGIPARDEKNEVGRRASDMVVNAGGSDAVAAVSDNDVVARCGLPPPQPDSHTAHGTAADGGMIVAETQAGQTGADMRPMGEGRARTTALAEAEAVIAFAEAGDTEEGTVTPARPRQLAGKFKDACGEDNSVTDVVNETLADEVSRGGACLSTVACK